MFDITIIETKASSYVLVNNMMFPIKNNWSGIDTLRKLRVLMPIRWYQKDFDKIEWVRQWIEDNIG